jgi:hypothetical protein
MKSRLTIFYISIILFGCSKKESLTDVTTDEPQGKILSRIIITSSVNNAVDTIYFFYNSNGSLKTIVQQSTSTYFDKKDFSYDGNGRLSKVLGLQSPCSTCGSSRYTDSLVYKNEKLSEKFFRPETGFTVNFFKTNSYSYDLSGRMIADTLFGDNLGTISTYIKYRYDSNNNIIESQNFNAAGIQGNSFRYNLTITNNPFYSNDIVGYIYYSYLFSHFFRLPSESISNTGNSISNYTYELFNNGMPKLIIHKYTESNQKVETRYRLFYN